MLQDIIDIGNKKLELIESKGYILERSVLGDLLGLYGAHLRALRKASEHELNGLDSILEPLCFPKELDGAIYSEILRLQDEYKQAEIGKFPKIEKKESMP